MNQGLKAIYEQRCDALAALAVTNAAGDPDIGTAFHIGDGWLLTARHVVESAPIRVLPESERRGAEYTFSGLQPDRVLPSDDDDLALIHCDFPVETHIEIGGHLDDWINEEFILSEVLVLGYPKIPLTRGPVLVTVSGEVNSVIDLLNERHPRFLISTTPRGGFSGGPVLSEFGPGMALGVLTESLVHGDEPAALGHSAIVSVEPIWNLLHANGIYPGKNAELLRELYDQ